MRYFTPLLPREEIRQSHCRSKLPHSREVNRGGEQILREFGMGGGFEAAVLDGEGIAGRRFLRGILPVRKRLTIEQKDPAGLLFLRR
jgi:hypothetical protein